jgi:LysM repeat protein
MLLKKAGFVTLLTLTLTPSWGANSTVHEVAKGDQLLRISAKYYHTIKKAHKIIKANPGIDPNNLVVGETLVIPDPLENETASVPVKSVSEALHSAEPVPVQSLYEEDWKAKYENLLTETEIKDKEAQYWKARYLKAFSQQDSLVSELKEEKQTLQKENENLEKLLRVARDHHEKNEVNLSKDVESLSAKLERSQIDLTRQQEKYQALNQKFEELHHWKKERQDLLAQLNTMAQSNKRLQIENENLSAKGDVFVRQTLASNEEFIQREKGRILSERLWVEKNKSASECKVVLKGQPIEAMKADDLLTFLSTQFGPKSFFIDPSENKVIIRIPGESVAGVESPRLRQKYQISLSKLAGFIKDFSVRSAKIETFDSHKGQIMDESGAMVDKDQFNLKQSKTIISYLNNKMFIPQSELAVGKGSNNIVAKKNAKYFDLSITFNKGTLESGTSDKPVDEDHSTSKLLTKLIAESDIQVGSMETKDGIVELDLPRDAVFGSSNQLRSSGKTKLTKLLNLFTNTPDVGVEVLWAPGQFDRNEEQNFASAIEDLDHIRKLVETNHGAVGDRVSFYQLTGRDVFRNDPNPEKSKLNKRIILRVVPYTLGIRFATL